MRGRPVPASLLSAVKRWFAAGAMAPVYSSRGLYWQYFTRLRHVNGGQHDDKR